MLSNASKLDMIASVYKMVIGINWPFNSIGQYCPWCFAIIDDENQFGVDAHDSDCAWRAGWQLTCDLSHNISPCSSMDEQ